MMILVIEDEKMLNRALEDALIRNKYQYCWVETGHDAWEKLSNNHYSLVILDVMVRPGQGTLIPEEIQRREMGLFLLKELRNGTFIANGAKPDTPVIICTAITDANNIEYIRELIGYLGAFYQKPKKPSEIMDKIKELLNQ
jgi:DNA-binding response OmpR family regulator